MVAQRRLDLLGGGEDDGGGLGDQVERRPEVVERQQLGEVGGLPALLGGFQRRQLGQLAVLGVELGRRRQLDPLGLAQRALGEGREPAHRLDLVAEQLDPHRPLLGRRVDVEDAAADRELAALLDLLDPLVAGRDEVLGDGAEVDLLALVDDAKPAGRSEASGTASASAVALATTTASASADERVEGVDPQPDQVRRRA